MAIPRTGVLGAAALGSLWLGAPLLWQTAATTQHAHSALSDAKPGSVLSAQKPRSTITAATPQGRVE
jgi:hypothetical protein